MQAKTFCDRECSGLSVVLGLAQDQSGAGCVFWFGAYASAWARRTTISVLALHCGWMSQSAVSAGAVLGMSTRGWGDTIWRW